MIPASVVMARPIPFEFLRDMCKMGQGQATCCLIILSSDRIQFQCARGTSLETFLRSRVRDGLMGAQGLNCDGPPFSAGLERRDDDD